MAMRNPWALPAAFMALLAVLAALVLGGEAIKPAFAPPPPQTSILRVPAQYATIQAAIDAAKAGDVIQVAAGTYNENLTINKPVELTAARPDLLNAANDSTVLDGGNADAAVFIPGGLTESPSITGFVIRNSQYGIDAHSQFVVEDDYFYGSQIAIRYQARSGGVNRGNVYFNSANDAVHVDDLSLPLLIQNNRFLYAGDDAIELDFPAAKSVAPVEAEILNNLLVGSSQDGLKLVDYGTGPQDANRRVVVAGNLIANNRRAGIGFVRSGNTNEDYSGADGAESVRVYNNTFYGNNYGISGGDNLVAFNNIIANTTSRGAWRVQGPTGSNSIIAYTLFWHNGLDTDQTTLGLGNVLGQDPLFMAGPVPGPDGSWGTVDDDFSGLLLQPGSPAIDRGVAQYPVVNGEEIPPSPLTGFTGAAPDMGWRESGSPLLATPAAIPTAALGLAPTETTAVEAAATGAPTATGVETEGSPTLASNSAEGSPSPSPTAATPSASASTTATAVPAVTGTPAVTIVSIAPLTAAAGQTVTLTVTGTGFQAGLNVSFEGGAGTPPNVMSVQVLSPTTLLITTQALNSTSRKQVWDIRISNPDASSALLERAFTMTP